MLIDRFVWRGGAEALQADHGAVETDVMLPAELCACLDLHPRPHRRGQNLLAVLWRLAVKD